jgi:DNA-binding response OmpR family regulator
MKNNTEVKRVLIVEDEPAICRVCAQVLTDEAYEVDIAPNGKIAEGMLSENGYDIIIMDIKLPVMDGKQLYQSLSLDLALKVIFTSGDTLSGDTEDFIEKTGRPFIAKPFTPQELMKMVREVC